MPRKLPIALPSKLFDLGTLKASLGILNLRIRQNLVPNNLEILLHQILITFKSINRYLKLENRINIFSSLKFSKKCIKLISVMLKFFIL